MSRGKPKSKSREALRREAKARLRTVRPSKGARPEARESSLRLLHELEVHQLELEMQNSELRRAEIELAKSRDRYRSLYDRAPFGYMTLEPQGTIVDANLTAAELLGLDRHSLVGLRLSTFMDRAASDRFHIQREAVKGSGTKQTCDLRLTRRDGRPVDVRLDMALDADAHAPLLNTVIVDLSDLRRTQDELRVSEGRFRQIAERIEDVFYVRELDGVVSYVSPAFETIWGRPVEWLVGKESAWLDTIDPEDRPRVAAAFSRLPQGGPLDETYRIRRPDGTTRWVQCRTFAVRTDASKVSRHVGVVRDVTTEHELEEQVRQAQKMEAVGTLAGGLAHNLRNVLQAILASIGLAELRGVESPRTVAALERAVTATNKAVGLIDQLMTFSRREESDAKLRPLRLDDELQATRDLLKALVGDSIQLELEPGAPGGVVTADPVQLEQILLNLAANARDAMPEGGTLTIRTRNASLDEPAAKTRGVPAGLYAVVTVRDSGVGMSAATRARLFEPFFTTKEVGKGTGLGLSTVFALVRQLGGCIDVDSELGAGSTFSIWLPSARGPIADALEAVDRAPVNGPTQT